MANSNFGGFALLYNEELDEMCTIENKIREKCAM